MPHLSNKQLILTFMLIVTASAVLLYRSYNDVKFTHNQASSFIAEQQIKHGLLSKMYAASRERSLILLKMLAENDPFELDDLRQQLSDQAGLFIEAREQFISLRLNHDESLILAEQDAAVSTNAPLQNKVADFFIEGHHDTARELLFTQAIPGQINVMKKINNMFKLYEADSLKIVSNIDTNFQNASLDFQILSASLLITSALFIFFTIQVSRREQHKLHSMFIAQKKISDELDRSSEKLSYQASHDGLTGLINRREFENRLNELTHRAEEDKTHFVLYLDLDQFKIVNDTCGHHAGDELLREVAAMMQSHVRKSDVISRLGGDEFGIILQYCDISHAEKVAQSIIQAISDFRFRWERKTFRIGVSIGITMLDDKSTNLSDIMRQIDSACYAAKEDGRNRFHIYRMGDEKLLQQLSDMDWVVRLDRALEQKQFILYAQPIAPITGDKLTKYNFEFLIRLTSQDDNKIIPPGTFLPAAERYNKIIHIDRWVITEALQTLSENKAFLDQIDYCSINLSCQSLTDAKFLDYVVDLFASYEELPSKICFEVTETAAIINLLQANRNISILRGMGLRFALDDFGSGLSSFGYLKTLPIDYLKIDGMFIRNIANDPIDRAMVKSIYEIGSVMEKTVIAEFVENNDTLNELRTIGIHYAQGYGIGKPLPLNEAIDGYLRATQT